MPESTQPGRVQVLVIEDDDAIRRLLQAAVKDSEFRLTEATNALDGLAALPKVKPEIVLLDLGLPDLDGVDVVRQLRQWSRVPVIIISAEGDEERKVMALEAGADDYVTKPFGIGELLARMRVAWRRSQDLVSAQDQPVLEFGDIRIDQVARLVWKGEDEVHLTPIEYRLLGFLAKHAGRVVTQRQILGEVWGDEFSEEAQYLRVYIGYLRKKLEDDPAKPTLILTEPRVGYRLRG